MSNEDTLTRLIKKKLSRLFITMAKYATWIATSKKHSRRLLVARLLTFTLFLYILYYFGVFTHLFERDLTEMRTPIKVNLQRELTRILREAKDTLADVKPSSSQLLASNANEHLLNFTFVYKAEHTCSGSGSGSGGDKDAGRPPFLLILVKSKVTHFEHRDAIRRTWAQADPFGLIKHVFLVGLPTPTNGSDADRVEVEHVKFADMVQPNFYDNYYNNTVKTFMGYRWALEYCSKAKYYLFIDDDFYLNPRLLMSYLQNNVSAELYNTMYAGYVFANASPMRHQISKWYISLNDYPYGKFPPYVAAGCYLLSPHSLRLFFMASKMFDIFKFDDIYLGILAYKLDIKPVSIESVHYYPPSYYPSVYADEVIAAHDFPPARLLDVWDQLASLIRFRPTSYEDVFKLKSPIKPSRLLPPPPPPPPS